MVEKEVESMSYVNGKYLDDYLENDFCYNKMKNRNKFEYKKESSRSLKFQMYQLKRSLQDFIRGFFK